MSWSNTASCGCHPPLGQISDTVLPTVDLVGGNIAMKNLVRTIASGTALNRCLVAFHTVFQGLMAPHRASSRIDGVCWLFLLLFSLFPAM